MRGVYFFLHTSYTQIHSGANESEEHNGNRPHIRPIHRVCIALRIYFVYKTHLSIMAVNAWARKHLRNAMPTAHQQSGFMARSAFLLRMCIPLRTKLHQTQARSAQERCIFNSGTAKHAQERQGVPGRYLINRTRGCSWPLVSANV